MRKFAFAAALATAAGLFAPGFASTAYAASVIIVTGNGLAIANGTATTNVADGSDFGTTTVGTAVSQSFLIANAGTTDLTVGAIAVPAGFTVIGAPSATIFPEGSSTLSVRCDASSANAYTGMVSIPNNDPTANPYTFAIACQVAAAGALAATPVPSLSEWGLALLSLLLTIATTFQLNRRTTR